MVDKVCSLFAVGGLVLTFSPISQADENWSIETIEVKSDDKSVMVPAAMFSGKEDYSVYIYREPEEAEFEKVWVLFSLDDDSGRLISSRDSLAVEVGDDTNFDTDHLKELGEEFYWQSLRDVGVRIWDGVEHFPYNNMMRGVIEGEPLKLSYSTVSGEILSHDVDLTDGKDLISSVLRVEPEIDPDAEEMKANLRNSYQEVRKQCFDFELGKFKSCLTARDICLRESNGSAQLFEGCFKDLFES